MLSVVSSGWASSLVLICQFVDPRRPRHAALADREKESVRELLDVLLNRVSEDDRLLLTLKEVQGLSLKELSEIYKVNTNALKVRLFRARKRVLQVYKELDKKNEV